MSEAVQWLSVLSRVAQLARTHGMSADDAARALSRLVGAADALAASANVDAGFDTTRRRLLSGLRKNLDDHPLLIVWVLRLASQLSPAAWDRFFHNFVLRLVVDRRAVLDRMTAELGHVPPVTLVVNPTMTCNLRCRGCYSFEFERHATMAPDMLRRILGEARDMGTRLITLTGGEPFAYRQLLDIVREFHDLTFLTYTNGTLIDASVADRLAELGNLVPAFSVEGFGPQTDERRGTGVHAKVMDAMRYMRERGVLFGLSATATRFNSEVLCSDAFIDYYLAQGVTFAWVFSYIPVGRTPELDLMPSPQQRDELRRATLRWRETRPLFLGDFWNDGATCGGCLSASRYAFIAPDGKVQPCTFVHFYTHDLHQHTLREVFQSPFFRAIRRAQPYGRNLLRSCKIIDHPGVLRRLVAAHGARPTYPGAEAIVTDPAFCAHLDAYASEYGKLAEVAWQGPGYASGRRALVPFSGYVDLQERFPDRMRNAGGGETTDGEGRGGGAPASDAEVLRCGGPLAKEVES